MLQLAHTSVIVSGCLLGLLGILLAVPGLRLRDVVAPLIDWLIKPR